MALALENMWAELLIRLFSVEKDTFTLFTPHSQTHVLFRETTP